MTRRLLIAVSLLAILGLAIGQTTWKLGHIRDTGHPTHQGALCFAERVEEKTEGRIRISVFPNSQLGSIEEMFVQVQTGDLEMVYGGINTLAFIGGGEAFEVTALPFLYRDYEHMRTALLSDWFKPIFEETERKTGIKVINVAGDTAPRGLSANRPIRNPEGFVGLRIRTAPSVTVIRAMKHLGALPIEIPFADLYVGLRTGVAEAQENGAIVMVRASLYEVQQYYMQTDYIRDIETWYVNPAVWNRLSGADQQAVYEVTEECGALVTELTQQMLADAYEVLEQHITVIRDPELDLEAIRAALEGVFDDWEGTRWPEGTLAFIRGL